MRRPGGCKITELQTMYKEGQLQPQKVLLNPSLPILILPFMEYV
jgi:hypothetical protein